MLVEQHKVLFLQPDELILISIHLWFFFWHSSQAFLVITHLTGGRLTIKSHCLLKYFSLLCSSTVSLLPSSLSCPVPSGSSSDGNCFGCNFVGSVIMAAQQGNHLLLHLTHIYKLYKELLIAEKKN